MKKILSAFFLLFCFVPLAQAKQVLPDVIIKNTATINAEPTGETGKKYFYCENGTKCSTEEVAIEYYKNHGYEVMRAEYAFWKGMLVLVFLDELYPQTLNTKSKLKFFDIENKNVSKKDLNKKLTALKNSNLKDFINSQLSKHEQGGYIRWLDEWEIAGYQNPAQYFKSPLVQEFLTKVDNKSFYQIIKHITNINKNPVILSNAKDCNNANNKILRAHRHSELRRSKESFTRNPLNDKYKINNFGNPVGTPDYITWNDNEMIFVEVKRKNEHLSPEQIEWGKFLIKNKIPYKVVRVMPIIF